RRGELPDEAYATARVVLVDASDPQHALHAARLPRAAGAPTVVDVDYVWPGLDELLRHIDIVIMPGAIVTAAAGKSELGSALAEIGRRSGALAVVATLGAEGAVGWGGG